MKTSSSTNNEQLSLLKSAYFDALASCIDSYSDEALSKLCTSEDAYMFVETGTSEDLRKHSGLYSRLANLQFEI